MNEEDGHFAHPPADSSVNRARESLATACANTECLRRLLEGTELLVASDGKE